MNPCILWTLDCSKRCLKCLAVSWEPTRYWMYRDIEYGRSACGANWEFQTPKNCFCCLLHCVCSGWYCSNKIKPQLLCFCEGFRVWKIIILSHVGTVTTSAVPLFLFPTTNLYVDIYYRMVGGTTTFFRHVTTTQDRNRNPRIQLILQFGYGGLGLFLVIIWMKPTFSTPPFKKSWFKSQEDPRIPDKVFCQKYTFWWHWKVLRMLCTSLRSKAIVKSM